MFGIKPLAVSAGIGDYQVKVSDLYSSIIPTAFSETALADLDPNGGSVITPSSSGTMTLTSSLNVIKPNGSLYLTRTCVPGSLTVTVSGATITDSGGKLLLGSTQIGSIDYALGLLKFNDSCPQYGVASKSITFMPGVMMENPTDSSALKVTEGNRGFVWVITLLPIPNKGSVSVSYLSVKQWYTLRDTGGGTLSGVDTSYGTGSINYETGTVTITTGAMPDVDSEIIYNWSATSAVTTAKGNSQQGVNSFRLTAETSKPRYKDTQNLYSAMTVSWIYNGTTYTIHEDREQGTNHILTTGYSGIGGHGTLKDTEFTLIPSLLPTKGTEITVTYQTPVIREIAHTLVSHTPVIQSETFQPVVDNAGIINIILSHVPIVSNQATQMIFDATADFDEFERPANWDGKVVVTIKATNDPSIQSTIISSGLGETVGTLNLLTGSLHLMASFQDAIRVLHVAPAAVGNDGTNPTATVYATGSTVVNKMITFKTGGTLVVKYFALQNSSLTWDQLQTVPEDITEVFTLDHLDIPVSIQGGQSFINGSLQVKSGTDTYVDVDGIVYRIFPS
ncbi:hypothetical protein CCP4SC76_3680001 [Gammaproteobacteria bacterium]